MNIVTDQKALICGSFGQSFYSAAILEGFNRK